MSKILSLILVFSFYVLSVTAYASDEKMAPSDISVKDGVVYINKVAIKEIVLDDGRIMDVSKTMGKKNKAIVIYAIKGGNNVPTNNGDGGGGEGGGAK